MDLKEPIEAFFEEYDIPDHLAPLSDEDWGLLSIYDKAMQVIVESGKILEGELYPTSSSVIPFLDNIVEQISLLKAKARSVAGQQFLNNLSINLLSNRRFPDCYKFEKPYNILTLLDLRHADLYFDHDHLEKVVKTLLTM